LLLRGIGVLSGTSEAGSSITIHDSNGSTIQTTTGSSGTWSAGMAAVTNTVHSFVVSAQDAAGHDGSVNVVFGTAGNDMITNTAPNEILSGNGGTDTFAFSGTVGNDTITDFQSNDVLQLSHNAFTNFADVLSHAAQVGTDVTITIDQSNSITLHDTSLSHLTSSNVHIV
jgi:Ca2+-binding RTX toxin-like protein